MTFSSTWEQKYIEFLKTSWKGFEDLNLRSSVSSFFISSSVKEEELEGHVSHML